MRVLNVGILAKSMQSDVVWSINIMIAILLVGVCITLYWIFKYDEWYPNDDVHSHVPSERGPDDSGREELGE
jgi:hypothetical protein